MCANFPTLAPPDVDHEYGRGAARCPHWTRESCWRTGLRQFRLAGAESFVPQRFTAAVWVGVVVVRMCDDRCMGGELDETAAAFAVVVGRPMYARSDDELVATLVDTYAFVSQGIAFIGAMTHDAAGRDLPGQVGSNGIVAWLRDKLRCTPAEAAAGV